MKLFIPLSINYNPHKHIQVLDGVRGLAILLVLLFHLFKYISLTNIGWIGVDLFFVLSGFLITGILLNTKTQNKYFISFIGKRALRIFPLYYLFLTIFFLILPLSSMSLYIDDYTFLHDNQKWFWTYTQNWYAAFSDNWQEDNIISHFWSLAIEEQFYIFWPLVVYFSSKKNLLKIIGILILLSISARFFFVLNQYNWITSYISTIARLDNLCIGSALAVIIRNRSLIYYLNKYSYFIFYLSLLILLAIVISTGSILMTNKYFLTFGFTIIAIFFSCIILISLSSHQNNIIRKILSMPIFTFLGKYSYGIYIYHEPIYRIFSEIFFKNQLNPNNIINKIVVSTIVLAVVIIVSWLSFHCFEVHFLKLKKYLTPSSINQKQQAALT